MAPTVFNMSTSRIRSLNDLQCAFAVHRITSWIRNGTDLDLMVPALAVYMGLVGLSSTESVIYT
jgi:hypothetical protein